MTSLPVPVAPAIDVQHPGHIGALPLALQDALRVALDLALAEHSDATRRAYASGFADFSAWCSEFDLTPLPAHHATVAGYLAALVDPEAQVVDDRPPRRGHLLRSPPCRP